jgi:hypothetical protein
MALSIKGIGSVATRVNEITPEFDAHLLSWLTAYDKAILKGHLGEFAVTRSGNAINIAAGLFFVYGYACLNSSIVTLTQQYGTGTSYAYVYFDIDLSGSTGKFQIKLTTPSTSEAVTWTQNNLFTNPVGRYQQAIAKLTITASSITVTDLRADLLLPYPRKAKEADDYSTAGTIKTKFDSVDAVAATKAPIASPVFTGTPTITSIPTAETAVVSLTGNGTVAVTQTGQIDPGWYRVELAGGGGGRGGNNNNGGGGAGGNGGKLGTTVYLPFRCTYRISAGGGGAAGADVGGQASTGGGGGGGSVLDIPQLGILLFASGGGGGGGRGWTGGSGTTGGGGGRGGVFGTGGGTGAGGGYDYAYTMYADAQGAPGGSGSAGTSAPGAGTSGRNNLDHGTGGGAAAGANGWARLYRLT